MQCWLSYFDNRTIIVTATETTINVVEVGNFFFFSVSWKKKECLKSHHIIDFMFIYQWQILMYNLLV